MAGVIGLNIMEDSQKKSHFWNVDYKSREIQQILFILVLSGICDFFVLSFHSSTVIHPKFRLNLMRQIALAVHVVAGVVEIFCFTTGFFAADVKPYAYVAVLAAFIGHIPSGLHMWPGVFGTKMFMIPCYFIFFCSHASTGYSLFHNPSDAVRLMKMSIALHGYVWVRISIALLKYINIFQGQEYTIAILFAGFLMSPAIDGPAANFVYPLSFVLFKFVINPFLKRFDLHLWEDDDKEYNRDTISVNEAHKLKLMKETFAHFLDTPTITNEIEIYTSDRDLAMAVFNVLDSDNSGRIDLAELPQILSAMELVGSPQKYMELWDVDRSNELSFNEFYGRVWNYNPSSSKMLTNFYLGKICHLDTTKVQKISDEVKGRYAFKLLDEDFSGSLNSEEICQLLVSWGLAGSIGVNAMKYRDNKELIDLPTFIKEWKFLWDYLYENSLFALQSANVTIVKTRPSVEKKLD
eukprot:gene7469-10180_t